MTRWAISASAKSIHCAPGRSAGKVQGGCSMRLLRSGALAAAACVLASSAFAQTKIAIGKISGGIGLHIPSYVAMDKGFYKEEGLDARFVELGGSAMVRAGLTNNLNFI